MLEFIKMVLKGAVIGIANIVPGVSGGTMAVSMGIYDVVIHAITHLLKEFKKSIKTVIPIAIGAVIGIVGVARIIEFMFIKIPVQTNLLFIGLILGGIPLINHKIKGKSIRFSQIIAFFLFFALVVVMAIIGEGSGKEAILHNDASSIIKMFVVGVVASATMVIPGVSGSMVLLLIGFYNPVLSMVNDFVSALVAMRVEEILSLCVLLVPFGLGVVIGIFAIAKLVEILLSKYPNVSYSGILGLIVASPFAICYMNLDAFSSVQYLTAEGILTIVTSILAFAVGFFIAKKLGD